MLSVLSCQREVGVPHAYCDHEYNWNAARLLLGILSFRVRRLVMWRSLLEIGRAHV